MRTLKVFLLVFAVALVAGPLWAQTPPVAPNPVTLQVAAARGLVEFSLAGTGGSSGDSVILMLRKTAKAGPVTLVVSVPAGTVLHSSNARDQSMVVSVVRGIDLGGGRFRPTTEAVLRDQGWVTLVLSAFCLEFEKENPTPTTTFRLEEPDAMLACVTTNSRRLSIAAQQAAVWVVTDHVTFAHMNEKFNVSSADWSAATAVVRQCGTAK